MSIDVEKDCDLWLTARNDVSFLNDEQIAEEIIRLMTEALHKPHVKKAISEVVRKGVYTRAFSYGNGDKCIEEKIDYMVTFKVRERKENTEYDYIFSNNNDSPSDNTDY